MINSKISVVIPVYNEQDCIAETVLKTEEILKNDFEGYELIIVDDGSTDKTPEILNKIANDNIILLKHSKNENIAKSLADGFKKAKNNYITFNSADMPLNPDDFKNIIEKSMNFDLIVVERDKYNGASLWRKTVSLANRIILHIFYPLSLIDVADANFTVIIKKNILDKIFPVSESPGFVLAEMIIKAKYLKYNVKIVSAKYNRRVYGKPHFGYIKDILWSLYDIIYFRIYSVFWIFNKK